jgi:hypothetical protein
MINISDNMKSKISIGICGFTRRIGVVALLMMISLGAMAESVQFVASAPRVVEVGEQFEITFTVNAQPSGFRPPEFKGLNLLGGPSTSSSSSVQFINGKVTQNTTFSYTYYFSANTPGTYTFDPAKATLDGKSYVSNSITIEVAGKASNAARQSSNNNQQQGQAQQSQQPQQDVVEESGGDDFFVRAVVDKTSISRGEHIVATIKLFSKYSISSIENVEYPSFGGFYRQDVETPQLSKLEKEVVNGQVYYTGVLQKMVLFPQKNGEIVIEPFSLQAVLQITMRNRSRSVWDDFFGPQVREVRKKVKSKPVRISVSPFPAGAPADFKNNGGSYTFSATVNKNTVKTNDAVNLKVVIAGSGNIKLIEPCDIKFPSDFETYDPKVSVSSQVTTAGVKGSKTFEYLVIPRHAGDYTIPSFSFSYYDTKAKQYKTLSSGDINIKVEKGANDNSVEVVSGIDKQDIKFIGKDIQFIKTQTPSFRKKGEYIFGSALFILGYLLPLLLFIVAVIVGRKKIKENANVRLVRNKRANKIAQKLLREAKTSLNSNNGEQFYEFVLKAMWGYVSDKLGIPVAKLSRDAVTEYVQNLQLDEQVVAKFISVVDRCEMARYAPTGGSAEMQQVFDDAAEAITTIEQHYK